MQCQRCGKDLEGSTRCSFCGYDNPEGNVREMSRMERDFYRGVTIDVDGGYSNARSNGGRRYYSRSTIYTSSDAGIFSRLLSKFVNGIISGNILARVAAALIILAISALMFFIALPILFVILALGIALYTFNRIGR